MTPAASAAAGDGMQFVLDSCLSGCDCEIDRRPYHRNCGCALHKSRRRNFLRKTDRGSKVAFPIRKSWSEGCLAAYGSSSPASGSSGAVEKKMGRRKASMDAVVELSVEEGDE